MGDLVEVERTSGCSCAIKVHGAMCTLLNELIGRILIIFPAIEDARPRCSSGIRALCLLQKGIEKAEELLQNCSESSRFYLAITGGVIVSRFEKTRKLLEQSLSELQTMVPMILEEEISRIVDDLRRVAFIINSSEKEAGMVLRGILQNDVSILSMFDNSEIQALQFAASRINLKSQKDLLIEKISIKKMLDKVSDTDQRKKTILKYLWRLLKKHDKLVLEGHDYHSSIDKDGSFSSELFDETTFNGPSIDVESRLRHTQDEEQGVNSYEPTPQTSDSGVLDTSSISITSRGSLSGLHLRVDISSVSLGSADTSFNSGNLLSENEGYLGSTRGHTDNSSPEFRFFSSRHVIETTLLSDINPHSWESQCTAIEDVQNYVDHYTASRLRISSKNFVEPVIGFLKAAVDRQDVRAQTAGSRLFLTGVHASRSAIQCIDQDLYHLLASFLGTVMTKDVLSIFDLSVRRNCGMKLVESGALSSILKILDAQNKEFHEIAIRILYNLSTSGDPSLLRSFPLDCIPTLVSFLSDSSFAGHCIVLLEKLFYMEEARLLAVSTEGCIASIVGLLESDNVEEQEHGVSVLLTLCLQYNECCRLVVEEGIMSTLICIQYNGTERGKACALELFRLLDATEEDKREEDPSHDCIGSTSGTPHQSSERKMSPKHKGLLGKFTSRLKR